MKKKLTKRMLLGVLAAAMFGISASDAEAQTFTNTGAGTYNASCGAIIKLKAPAATATFVGGTNNMGSTAPGGIAIPGIVEWSSAADQTVQAYFYERLVLSGAGAKNVLTGVVVSGTQCPTNLYGTNANYAQLPNYPFIVAGGTGIVTYGDVFKYTGTKDQNIFPDTYKTIEMTGGSLASIRLGDKVVANVINSTADESGTPLVRETLSIAGELEIVGATGTSNTLAGNVVIAAGTDTDPDGKLTTGDGAVTITGTLTSGGAINTGVGALTASNTVALNDGSVMTTGVGDVTFTNAGTLTLSGDSKIIGAGSGDIVIDGVTAAGGSSSINMSTGTGQLNVNGNLTLAGTSSVTTGAGPGGTGELAANFTSQVNLTETSSITTGAGPVTFTATSILDLAGTSTLTTKDGNVTIEGSTTTAGTGNDYTINHTNITIDGAGGITFVGDLDLNGNLVVNDGTEAAPLGTLTIATTSVATISSTGSLDMGAYSTMNVAGTISNEGAGTNLIFDCTSNTNYTAGVQSIMPTIATNPYGNLTLSGVGLKTAGRVAAYPDLEESNINICKNFTLNGGNLDMITNSGYLALNDPTVTPTYGAGTGTEEVLGKMRRTYATSTDSYVFNNYQTSMTFTTDASAAGYYQFDVTPGLLGDAINLVDAANTVDRKIQMTYDIASWVGTVKAGYLASELPAFSGGMGESNLKFFEADGPNADDIEKLAGSGYTRDDASTIHSLSLAGIEPGTEDVDGAVEKEFTSGHDLVLRANNRMYNIADGRWTNPNSWDEGRIPTANDDVELVYTSYVGIKGGFIGTVEAGNQTPESTHYAKPINEGGANDANAAAAKSITIAQKTTGTNTPNPALIIGNEDNPATYIFKTVADGIITNNNTTANNTTRANWSPTNGSELVDKGTLQAGDIQGIWVVPYSAAGSIPGLGTNSINNAGTVNNQGIIEVGQ